jgi:HEAT repeat protein
MPRFKLDLLLAALLIALLAINPVISRAEDEPSYKDKKLSEWVQQLQKGGPIQRRAAAVAVSKMGANAKAAAEPLATIYKDEEVATVRLRIAEALISIDPDGKATLACLSDALVDQDGEVRQVAIDYFEKSGLTEPLCKVLKHKNSEARLSAAQGLAKLGAGGKKALQPLADAWKIEKNSKVRCAILRALLAIDSDDKLTTGTSLEALTDSSDDVRKVALARVNKLPAEMVVPALSQALENQADKIRLSAAQGLAKLGAGGKKPLSPLIRIRPFPP